MSNQNHQMEQASDAGFGRSGPTDMGTPLLAGFARSGDFREPELMPLVASRDPFGRAQN
jgi:hypothetical protein